MLTKRKRSQRQEKSVAKQMGAKTVVASGALWGAKGDVRSDQFLIECKTTEKPKYTVTAKCWEKIFVQATKDHIRTPLIVVDICDYERYIITSYNLIADDVFDTSGLHLSDCEYFDEGNNTSFSLLKGHPTPCIHKINSTASWGPGLLGKEETSHSLLVMRPDFFKELTEKWL